MHPALFQNWKISSALFSPLVGRESWIPAENRKILLQKYVPEKIPELKNNRFCAKTPFCFYMEKNLIKEVNNFWCCDCNFASTAAHLSEKLNTEAFISKLSEKFNRHSLKQLFQNPSPRLFPWKYPNFMTHYHFVSSWKSIYRKRCLVFDNVIRIVQCLLQNYVRNSMQELS